MVSGEAVSVSVGSCVCVCLATCRRLHATLPAHVCCNLGRRLEEKQSNSNLKNLLIKAGLVEFDST